MSAAQQANQPLPMIDSMKLNESVDALNAGDFSKALSISSQLRTLSPSPQALYVELMAMIGLGMVKQTERLLRKTIGYLEQWPDGVGMSGHVQGRLAMRNGKPEAAVPFFRVACERLTKNQSCFIDYAEALFHTGQFAQAHDLYVHSLSLGASTATIYGNMAACAMRMQNFDQAFAYNYVAWTQAPSSQVAQQIGRAFILANQPREAAKYFSKAANLPNATIEAYHGMADALHRMGLYRRALHYLKIALATPNLPLPQEYLLLQSLGACYEKMGLVHEWIPYSMRLLQLEPNNIKFLLNMGNAMQMLGRYDEALEWADKAEAASPGHPDIVYFRGFIKLLMGDWNEGWRGYEWRWQAVPFREKYGAVLKPLQSPLWDGKADLKGKLVMALCEQGAGDLIQFSLYVKDLVDRGATVDLLVPPSMNEIMSGMPWIRTVHDNYFKVPPHDYHISLMTMPLYVGTTIETIPTMHQPVIKLPEGRKRKRFSPKFTVGLAWYGDPKHSYDAWRSMPTHYLHEFIKSFPEVQFVSLHIQPHTRTLKKYLKAGWLIDGVAGGNSFTDTAAAIDACDLVISVDTSTAHLAAAMHKPVWMLISTYFDWRWLGDDHKTQWYPTMRIFRQKKVHDWRELLKRVGAELRPMLAMRPIDATFTEESTPELSAHVEEKASAEKPTRLKRVVSSTRKTLVSNNVRSSKLKRSE